MWFTFALITVFAWAGSDLFSKMGTKPQDKNSHWRLVMMVGLVMGIHAVGYLLVTGISYSPINIIKYFPVSFLYILSMTLGYAGLRYIELSVSSPICNSSGAVTAVLCFFLLKQTMGGMQLLAVCLISIGIIALAILEKRSMPNPTSAEEKKYRVGVLAILFPILYCIIDGLGSFMDAYYLENLMSEAEANLSYEFTFLLAAAIAFIYLKVVKRETLRFQDHSIFGLGAICETAGQFTYVYAMADNAIVAAPMIASYSIVSVLLSRIFLREKLRLSQYVMIFLVMAGIAILGFLEG